MSFETLNSIFYIILQQFSKRPRLLTIDSFYKLVQVLQANEQRLVKLGQTVVVHPQLFEMADVSEGVELDPLDLVPAEFQHFQLAQADEHLGVHVIEVVERQIEPLETPHVRERAGLDGADREVEEEAELFEAVEALEHVLVDAAEFVVAKVELFQLRHIGPHASIDAGDALIAQVELGALGQVGSDLVI